MKKLGIIILVLIVGQVAVSQDLIVTRTDDSLNCKITDIKPDYIFFTLMSNREIKKSVLPMGDVKIYQRNFYYKSGLPIEYLAAREYPKFRIAIRGGYSYLFAKIPPNLEDNAVDYFKSLKSGFHFGADVNYFFNKTFGIGLKFSLFKTKANGQNILFDDGQGGSFRVNISDDRTDFLVGPSFIVRVLAPVTKNAFIAGATMGYFSYNDNVLIGNIPAIVKGSTLGMVLDLGYDLRLSDDFSLLFAMSVTLGGLTVATINGQTIELPEGEVESMSRIDLSIGFSFNK